MSGSTIRFNTSLGAVDIRTRPDAAPKTVEVMLDLVRKGLFNGVSFYRAEKDFVIQGGLTEPSGKARKSPHGNIPLEYKLPNKRGTVTMARWTEPDTATSEFFINLGDNPHLDKTGDAPAQMGYAVWGEVTAESWGTIAKIAAQPTEVRGGLSMIQKPVEITKAEVL